jgi:serpin B
MKRSLAVSPALLLVAVLPLFAEKPAEPPPPSAVARGNNAFAFDLYARLREKDGNLFFSPYSISAGAAMTSAGANGKTLDEMKATFRFPEQEKLHPAHAALARDLKSVRGCELRTANRLWGQKDYGFRPELRRTLDRHYGAALEEVDFARGTEEARRTINGWVEKETQDKIKNLLQPGILTTQTRFVLTNAIYFKGDWLSQFKKDRTKPGPFRTAAGKQVEATLMHQDGPFLCADEKTFLVVSLPYVGKDLAMVVLLPKKADGLAELEKSLTVDRLNDVLKRLRGEQVRLTLPKFKLSSEFRLDKTLGDMGMPSAFAEGEADLSGFTGQRNLHLQAVVHKAFVEVNEEGTTAAAATAFSGGEEADHSITFRADHAFLFLIRDERSGAILFMGRLSDPTK